jgi:hypothetical protein
MSLAALIGHLAVALGRVAKHYERQRNDAPGLAVLRT